MTSLGFGLGKISAYDKLFADFTLHCSHAWQRDFVGAATLGGIAGPKARHASLYYPSQNFSSTMMKSFKSLFGASPSS